jgi:hypothetical protein
MPRQHVVGKRDLPRSIEAPRLVGQLAQYLDQKKTLPSLCR